MNFWNQIPDITKLYLAILLGLSILLVGLVAIRTDALSVGWPSPGDMISHLILRGDAIPTPGNGKPSAFGLQDMNILSGPGNEYEILGKLKKDQVAEIIGMSTDGRWWVIKLRIAESKQGWVAAEQVRAENTVGVPAVGMDGEFIAIDTATPAGASVVALRNTEIFSEPRQASAMLGLLEAGQRAEVVGISPDNLWWAIKIPYVVGEQGWVEAGQVKAENVEGVSVATGPGPDQTPEEDLPRARAVANVNVRSGPGMNYRKVATLQNGQEARILGVAPDGFWWLIQIPGEEDSQGWVSIDYVLARNADNVPVVESQGAGGPFLVTTPEPGAPALTATTLVNIRSGPGKQHEVIGRLEQGQTAEIIGRSTDGRWWAIKLATQNNAQGWVAAAFVNVINGENVPVIDQ